MGTVLLAGVLIPYLPLLEHPESRLLHSFGNKETDASFTLRDYWATAAVGSTPFTNEHDPFMGAPEGVPVAASVQVANALQPAVVWLFRPALGFVGAWNALLLLGVVGTALAFYGVLIRLRVPAWASAVGAYGATASPWFLVQAQSGHVGLLQEWPLALALLGLARLDDRRSIRSAAELGVLWGLSFYAFNYVGAFVSLLVAVGLVVFLLRSRRVGNLSRAWTLVAASIGSAVTLLLPAVLDVLLSGVRGNPLGARTLADFFGTSLRFFFIPSHYNPLLRWVDNPHIVDEQQLYLSVTLVALAAVAIAAPRVPVAHSEYIRPTAGATCMCGIALALPHNYDIFGLQVEMPAAWLGKVTTVFDINARFGYVALTMLAVLAALGLAAIPGNMRRVVIPAAIALLAVEFAFATLPTWERRPPPHDAWLASHPGGIVAYYPMFKFGAPFSAMENQEYSLQPIEGHPIFNMLPVTRPDWLETREFAIRALTKSLTDSTAAGVLAGEGVKWVVVRDDVERALGETPPMMPSAYYRLVAKFPEARVFRVIAPPIDIDGALAGAHTTVAWAWGATTPALHVAKTSGTDLTVTAAPGSWNEGYLMQLSFASTHPGAEVVLADGRGRILAQAPARGAVSLGPFPIPSAGETLHLRLQDDSRFTIGGAPTLVPYAYYSSSVN